MSDLIQLDENIMVNLSVLSFGEHILHREKLMDELNLHTEEEITDTHQMSKLTIDDLARSIDFQKAT